jgi:hypothetical protein
VFKLSPVCNGFNLGSKEKKSGGDESRECWEREDLIL